MNQIDLSSMRARQARLGKTIGKKGYILLLVLSDASVVLAILSAIEIKSIIGYLLLSLATIFLLPAIWWKKHLSQLTPSGNSLGDRISGDLLARLDPKKELTALSLWDSVSGHWQTNFITHHLLMPSDQIRQCISDSPDILDKSLELSIKLADLHGLKTIEPGLISSSLMLNTPGVIEMLSRFKLHPADLESVTEWLSRNLAHQFKDSSFGGIGRDWAFGWTPLLDKIGHNISLSVARTGTHFGWLTESPGVLALEAALANNAYGIVLIGQDGIGKSNSVYALAQKLIEGKTGKKLAYHQIIEINATDISSRLQRPGDLERIMVSLANEVAHAGHVILFLDNAQLFLSNAPGGFDASQILLSMIQAKSVQLIMAMTPSDYQRLRSSNQSLANLLVPIVLKELDEHGVMQVLEDYSLGLEHRNKILITYEALKEAYRLSGRYNQDEAYPGKAIKLLDSAATHIQNSILNVDSVQAAVEQTHGVKVAAASPAEADELLNLEARIHERMINQDQAVSAVASSLRRARAGVTNPRRPIGSFLFLGPTGVGKTELAKAVAATYFGSEQSIIRLDMSEYQNPDDASRLLSSGQDENLTLLMSVRQQPFTVVLLDELEKAHPNVLNLLLQLLDEGQLTDSTGRAASFKDAIIIATSNAGANTIRQKIAGNVAIDVLSRELSDELISTGQFKPELINRFDEVVVFRPLTQGELTQVVSLMLKELNTNLKTQNISVELTPKAINRIAELGNDPAFGARPIRRLLQRVVENAVAEKILTAQATAGDHIILSETDLKIEQNQP